MSYTPSNILGSTGLLQNQGFDLALISGICSNYNSQALPLAYRDALNAAAAVDAAAAAEDPILNPNVFVSNYAGIVAGGTYSLPGLLGITPTSPNYVPYIGGSGLANAAIAQAQLIFPSSDISALIQNLSRCSGIASITGELFRTSRSIADRPISDFGPLEKYTDLTTAGLGRLSKTSNTNLATTGAELKKLGTAISLEAVKAEDLEDEIELNDEVRDVSQAPINIYDSEYGPENYYNGPAVEVSTPDGSTVLTVDIGKKVEKPLKGGTPSINNPVDFVSNMLKSGGGDIGKLTSKILVAFFGTTQVDATGTKRSAGFLVAAEETGDGAFLILAGSTGVSQSANTSSQTDNQVQAGLIAAVAQSDSGSVQAGIVAAVAQKTEDAIQTGLTGLSTSTRRTIDNELANKLSAFRKNKFAQAKATAVLTEIDNAADIQKTKELFKMGNEYGPNNQLLVSDPSSITVRRLADIPNFQKDIPEIKAVVDPETIKDTGSILNQIPGTTNVNSFADIGNILSQLEDAPASPILDARSTFYSVSELNQLKNYIPIFDNDEVGPTVADMVGVVAGGPVGTAISNAASGIVKSLLTTEGQNILSNLEAITSTMQAANIEVNETSTIQGYVDNIEAAMDSLLFSSNGYKQEVVALAGTGYVNGCRLLTNQKTSLARFDVDLTQVSFGAKIPLVSFGRSIGDIAKDPAMEAILVNLCSSNKYGEALKLHITEKKNITIMQKFNINPSNVLPIPKIDPDLFSF